MCYTSFGEYFKILRIKHHEVLADAKDFLGVSSAFISSVECGKKTIPACWYDLIVAHYKLNKKDSLELRNSIDESKKNVNISIENMPKSKREVAIQFQRSFDDLDEKTAKEIINILDRNK